MSIISIICGYILSFLIYCIYIEVKRESVKVAAGRSLIKARKKKTPAHALRMYEPIEA